MRLLRYIGTMVMACSGPAGGLSRHAPGGSGIGYVRHDQAAEYT